MLLLASTSDKLQIITAQAVTVDVHASWVDRVAGPPEVITPGRTNSALTTATTTDVVAAPAASTVRNIQTLNVRNKHATSSNLITVQHTDGTIVSQLIAYTLLAGEELQYLDGVGFKIIDAGGGQKIAAAVGRFLGTTIILSGTTAFVTKPETKTIFCRLMAGGGAGGGCTSVAAAAAGAGGGGGGGYAEKTFLVLGATSYVVAVGAGGTGVSAAAGNPGGITTIAVSGVTVTAFGGLGGAQAVPTTTLTVWMGGASGAVATNGDLNEGGSPGEAGIVLIIATPIVLSGNGGSSNFGAGALGIKAVGNGNNATIGFGGGGSGSATGASVARTGGNGANGVLIIDEYS